MDSQPSNGAPKTRRVFLDSAQRDAIAYPTPARYEIVFDEDLFDVSSMRLAVADVPFPAYVLDARRCSLPFQVGAGGSPTPTLAAQLPVGNYSSAADVASELADALNAAAGGAGGVVAFWVAATPRTDALVVWSTAPVALPLAGRGADTPAAVLGFAADQTYVSTAYAPPAGPPPPPPAVAASSGAPLWWLAAPYRCDLRPPAAVVLDLSVPPAEQLISANQAADRAFAVLYPEPGRQSVNATSNDLLEKRWSPPLARVARIRVQFSDLYGNAYDFQNQDHRLELVFECVGPPKFGTKT